MFKICLVFDSLIDFVQKSKQLCMFNEFLCEWKRLEIKLLGMSYQSYFSLGGTQSCHMYYHAPRLFRACKIFPTSVLYT